MEKCILTMLMVAAIIGCKQKSASHPSEYLELGFSLASWPKQCRSLLPEGVKNRVCKDLIDASLDQKHFDDVSLYILNDILFTLLDLDFIESPKNALRENYSFLLKHCREKGELLKVEEKRPELISVFYLRNAIVNSILYAAKKKVYEKEINELKQMMSSEYWNYRGDVKNLLAGLENEPLYLAPLNSAFYYHYDLPDAQKISTQRKKILNDSEFKENNKMLYWYLKYIVR